MTPTESDEARRLRILVIDRSPPVDLTQGSSLIAHHLFERLHQRHDLTLVCPASRELTVPEMEALEARFERIHLVARDEEVPAISGWLEGRIAGLPFPRIGPLDIPAARRLRDVVRACLAEGFDIMHTRTVTMGALTMDLDHDATLLEMGDSISLGTKRARASGLRSALQRRAAGWIERSTLASFDAVTTVARADGEEMQRLAPDARVHVIPTGVDGTFFDCRSNGDVATESPILTFVGAMSYPPNIAAVLTFVNEVLPLVRQQYPEVRFTIVGRDPHERIRALASTPGVEVTGFVPDVRPYLAEASVVVVPMVSGSGIKNKVMEAFAMGRPVVATSLGVEGVEAEPGRDLLVADEPAAFADAVVRLITDANLAARVGAAARNLVEERYTWDACARRYDELYQQLTAASQSA
jgi:glycosyltransferase involved in cell wall biosynthesis